MSAAIALQDKRLPAREVPACPMTLITGGKGGVGKTTLALNLAVELARARERVLLVDLDLGLANIHVLLRMHQRGTFEDVLRGRASLEQCLLPGPEGMHVLPAASGTGAMADLSDEQRRHLLGELARLSEGYTAVVGDSAAGIGPLVLDCAAAARHVLVVTTPEPAALADAYGLIKALDRHGELRGGDVPTPELFLNMVEGLDDAERAARKLRGVCERFLMRSPRMAGWLPRSSAIARGAREQRPFALSPGDTLEAGCLRRLARHLRLFSNQAQASHGR
jgi:MinD-like ATPase involved in chromosome partitioning or flagellar assembly